MTFGTPLALLGLLVLPLIIALHLRRSAIRQVEVPSLIVWEGLGAPAQTGGKRWRVENIYSLLLQLAAAAALSIALARPAGLAAPATTRVYVLDAGILMSVPDPAPSRMHVAQSAIERDIQSAPAGTTFTIVAAGSRPRVVVSTTDHALAMQSLNTIMPIAVTPNLSLAVNVAAGLVPAGRGRLQIVYARGETAPSTPPWLTVATPIVVGRSTDNQAITSLNVRCRPGATSCDALAAVRNDADVTVEDVVAISADSSALGHQTLALPGRSITDLSFSVPATRRIVQLYLTGTDITASDNLAWAVVPHEPMTRVLVVGESARTTPIVRALRAARVGSITTLAPDRYGTGRTLSADLLVLAGWLPTGPLPAAPSVLLVDPPSFPGSPASKPVTDATISGIDASSPLMTGLDLTSLDIPAAGARLLSLPPALRPIVWSAGGTLIAAGTLDGARVAAVDFDPSVSNFSQLPAFPEFFANVARWSADWYSPTATPGDSIGFEVPASTGTVTVTRAASLTTAGVRVPVHVAGAAAQAPVMSPGIYTITEHGAWGARTGIAVANSATAGITPAPAPIQAPRSLNLDADMHTAASWWPLLGIVAALLLVAELLFTPRRTERGSSLP
jgi:hypothetical protein